MTSADAFKFLCERWRVLDDIEGMTADKFSFMLFEFEEIHGKEAVEKLAGFYLYSIKNFTDEDDGKQKRALTQVFSHDLFGRKETCMLPRSDGYHEYWINEFQIPSNKANEHEKKRG